MADGEPPWSVWRFNPFQIGSKFLEVSRVRRGAPLQPGATPERAKRRHGLFGMAGLSVAKGGYTALLMTHVLRRQTSGWK